MAKALRKHLGMKALEQVVTELVEIPGDKNFRDSIERLVHALPSQHGTSGGPSRQREPYAR